MAALAYIQVYVAVKQGNRIAVKNEMNLNVNLIKTGIKTSSLVIGPQV